MASSQISRSNLSFSLFPLSIFARNSSYSRTQRSLTHFIVLIVSTKYSYSPLRYMLECADSASAWHSLIWKRSVERSEESLICLVVSSLRLFLRESRVWCADERRVRRRVISALWEGLGLVGCDMLFFFFFFLGGGRAGVSGRKGCNGNEVSGFFFLWEFEVLWLETGGYVSGGKGGVGYVEEYSTYLLMHLTHKYEMLCDCSLAEELAGCYL